MANTRARSYNTLTYNGGKHILNSKIAMKKRLLHKYKIEPPTSTSLLTEPKKAAPSSQPSTSDRKDERREDMDTEVIDVETIPEVSDSKLLLLDNNNKIESIDSKTDEILPSSSSAKPSLEQVVARCRLKSSESEKLLKATDEVNKSALENLRAVVNSVTTSDEECNQSSSQEDSSSADSNMASKRYLSPQAKTILNEWFRQHLYRPYPTYEEKKDLANQCGISSSKVDTWFANKRNRTHNTKKLPPKYSHLLNMSAVLSD